MDSNSPAIATPDATNPAAPVPGKNRFTEGQAKREFEDKGYNSVPSLNKGEVGVWTALLMKDGEPVEMKLDYQGNITAPLNNTRF
jgi:hypothetical protein